MCEEAWKGQRPIDGNVRIRVIHYYETIIGDVDNLTKPIQDALQGIVYVNDRQVNEVTGKRLHIDDPYRVRFMSKTLGAAFSDGREFVHIRVWLSPKQENLG